MLASGWVPLPHISHTISATFGHSGLYRQLHLVTVVYINKLHLVTVVYIDKLHLVIVVYAKVHNLTAILRWGARQVERVCEVVHESP